MTRWYKAVLLSAFLVGITACVDPEEHKSGATESLTPAVVVKMPKDLMTYSEEELMLLMGKHSTDKVVISDLFENNEKQKKLSFKGKLIIKEDGETYLDYIDGAEISVDLKLE